MSEERKNVRKDQLLRDIETCNYWLDKYEAAGNTFCFDEWYVKREHLLRQLRGLHGTP